MEVSMRKIGFSLMLLIGAGLVLFLSAHDLLSPPPIEFAPSNVSPLIAPSGPGEFLVSKAGPFFGLSGSPVPTGDFNNDGNLDLATIDSDGLNLRLGNGDATFQPPKLVLSNNVLGIAAVGDFNEDGNLDLVVATSTRIVLLLGNGKGGFPTRPIIFDATGCNLSTLVVADLNNDGHLDVVGGSCTGVLLGNGNGTFQTPKPVALNLVAVAAADVNNDGKLDLLEPNGTNIGVLLGNGDGTFQPRLTTSGLNHAQV